MNFHSRPTYLCIASLILPLLATSVGFGADNDAKSANDKPLVKTTHVYKTVSVRGRVCEFQISPLEA